MLLMDEPFAALDAQNRVILQAELVRLWEQTGKTVIYVTHSIEEALLMGDRTVIMTAQPGRIKQIIDVPFPHPRDLMQLSASAEFGKLKLDIWRVLEEEVNAGAGGDGAMSGVSTKTQERLLYLISPIGLLVLWQVLLMLGIGDRRFIPAPSDIAARYWEMVVSGELAQHTAVTLYRVFVGLLPRQHSRHRGRPADGDVPPGAHLLRSADRGAVSDPEDRADAAACCWPSASAMPPRSRWWRSRCSSR